MKKLRLRVQLLFTILTNGYVHGFVSGKIYQGNLKYICVPGLNCYSCPGALSSCPMGALQALLNQQGVQIPFAVLGFFFVVGSFLGRFVCGWLCPFGLVQDLLHKIPVFRKRKVLPMHRILKYGKYIVLIFLAGIGSLFLFGGFAKTPAFCKYLCPSGTLFGAVPLLITNEPLRELAGGLLFWKLGILLMIVFLSVKIYRPFCQYLCPLGAIYGWFNCFSLVQIHWEKEKCTSCMACGRACPVALSVSEISKAPECIRCGKCVEACPEKCLYFSQTILSKKYQCGMITPYCISNENNNRRKRTMKNEKTYELVLTALFTAIIIIMAFTPLGYIPLVVINATIIHIPVILGALFLGPKKGAFLGFVFGFTSFINNTFKAVTPSAFVFSPVLAVNVVGVSGIFKSLYICFVPRILVGVVPYFVYLGLHRLLKDEQKSWRIVVNFAASVILFVSFSAFLKRMLQDKMNGSTCTTLSMAAGIAAGIVLFAVLTVAGRKKASTNIALAYAGLAGAFTNTLLVMSGIYILYKDAYAQALGIAGEAVFDTIMGIISFNGIVEAVVAAVIAAGVGIALLRVKPIKTAKTE